MYKDFLKICESRFLSASVIDAMYLYGRVDYMKLLHPQLSKHRKAQAVEVDILDPLNEYIKGKLPTFNGENEYYNLMKKAPRINNVSFEDNQYKPFKPSVAEKGGKLYKKRTLFHQAYKTTSH